MEEYTLGTLRLMYAFAVFGAGVVGFLTLVFPDISSRFVFFGATEVNHYLRILGAVWLALGAVAVFGVVFPALFVPVLLVQLLYKTAWLAVTAYPAIIAGNLESGLVFLTALFTAWILALSGSLALFFLTGGFHHWLQNQS